MENKKEIWIINHYAFPYGYGFHTRQHTIGRMLIDLGYSVTIFASSFNHLKMKNVEVENIYKEEFHDNIKYIWVKTQEYKGNGLGRIKNIFEFSKKLQKIYKNDFGNPDLVWVSSPQPFSIYNGIKIKKYFKSKFIFEERDIWPLTLELLNGVNKYNPLILIFRYLQLQGYKNCDLIITPLNNLKEFVSSSGYKNKIIEYIPQPFVNFKIENFNIDLPTNGFLIGYVGSIGHSNSVMNIIKAANLLKNKSNISFVIVGDGPQVDEIKNYILTNNLKNVILTGKLTKERAMYIVSKCNILYKGNPNIELYKYGIGSVKLAEYMWFNKPIIHATNIKNDLVSLSNSGILIDCDNESKLSETILTLKNDKQLYSELSNNGKTFVEENLMEKEIQFKLKNILAKLMKEKS